MTLADKDKYIVLIVNWTPNGGHWIKGFSSLDEAKEALRGMVAEHQEVGNKAFIIRGEIEQIGAE